MRHPHTRLYVHLVWATWDRAPLITPDIRDRIYTVMQHQASELGGEIIAIGGVEDRVHVLLRYPPTLAISDLVGRMKGASSHMVTQVMGHPFKWQGAYGAFTLSRSGLARARAYVLNQEAHHRDGTTYPALEATDAPVRFPLSQRRVHPLRLDDCIDVTGLIRRLPIGSRSFETPPLAPPPPCPIFRACRPSPHPPRPRRIHRHPAMHPAPTPEPTPARRRRRPGRERRRA